MAQHPKGPLKIIIGIVSFFLILWISLKRKDKFQGPIHITSESRGHVFYYRLDTRTSYADGLERCKNLDWNNDVPDFGSMISQYGLESYGVKGAAKILNEAEQSGVVSVSKYCFCQWDSCNLLGGTDQDSEGEWKWDDGTIIGDPKESSESCPEEEECYNPTPTYSNWRGGEPNNMHNSEHYMTMGWGSEQWMDVPKSFECYMVCENVFEK